MTYLDSKLPTEITTTLDETKTEKSKSPWIAKLAGVFGEIQSAVTAGRAVDLDALMKKAGITDPKALAVADAYHDALSFAERMKTNPAIAPQQYEVYDKRLDAQIAEVEKSSTTPEDKTAVEKLKVAANEVEATSKKADTDQVEALTKGKKVGATLESYDGALKSIGNEQGTVPSAEELRRINAAQDQRLTKLGVPDESKKALSTLLDSAAAMRANVGDKAKFDAAKQQYLGALNNRTMWQTVSKDELQLFRKTLSDLEAMRPDAPKDEKLQNEAKTQSLRNRTNLEKQKVLRQNKPKPPQIVPSKKPVPDKSQVLFDKPKVINGGGGSLFNRNYQQELNDAQRDWMDPKKTSTPEAKRAAFERYEKARKALLEDQLRNPARYKSQPTLFKTKPSPFISPSQQFNITDPMMKAKIG
jgi:hypothetical protein